MVRPAGRNLCHPFSCLVIVTPVYVYIVLFVIYYYYYYYCYHRYPKNEQNSGFRIGRVQYENSEKGSYLGILRVTFKRK